MVDVLLLDYDVLVVGSGFGGSVSALRLTEKGYRVGVLEAGRRFTRATLPKNSWDLRNFLWAPALGCYGIQRIHLLGNVMVLAGAGVGGGSLNYANTLYVPPKAFFDDPQWGRITDWQAELKPYYDQAQRMLGVRLNPTMTPADVHLKAAAEKMGVGDTFHMAPVGVFFGDGKDAVGEDGGAPAKVAPGTEVPDPYFGGAGPARRACNECGECMTGCRHGAKNTLTENYLYLAEKAGAVVHPMDRRHRHRGLPRRLRGRHRAHRPAKGPAAAPSAPATWWWPPAPTARRRCCTRCATAACCPASPPASANSPAPTPRRWSAPRPTTAATSAPTAPSRLHPRRGHHLLGAPRRRHPHRAGPLRQGLQRHGRPDRPPGAVHRQGAPGGGLGRQLRPPPAADAPLALHPQWSERTIIGLVMQSLDNSLTTYRKKSGVGKGLLTARQGHGEPNPDQIPEATRAASLIAEEINGFAGSNVGELMGTPLTAHFLGGCPIGEDADHGVIDPYHRLYGHPGISVVDGSAVSANLGVNPSLTITAQAERAMSLWPNKGEADPRPACGQEYRRVAPVAPRHPAVPEEAFAALRLPLLPVPTVPARKKAQASAAAPAEDA